MRRVLPFPLRNGWIMFSALCCADRFIKGGRTHSAIPLILWQGRYASKNSLEFPPNTKAVYFKSTRATCLSITEYVGAGLNRLRSHLAGSKTHIPPRNPSYPRKRHESLFSHNSSVIIIAEWSVIRVWRVSWTYEQLMRQGTSSFEIKQWSYL